MAQLDKLRARLCAKPKDFTWDELVKLLAAFGFEALGKGKTAGSRRQFFNPATQVAISMHKPHPGNILKEYQLKEIITLLGIC
ncbi:type II toxin-antitoxin system HicA family toxin [Hymenobacter nivis]|uniref:Hexulose-6-phosphate synthase n=1 Tax=Hymenobacter nivis TaxID=1850093 RepID=A0A2Z3GIN8_9BACT|nr:type II toxin-antitoxin system HicA family toxin [Hymenobacter nivis]AWM32071.1 hexulose-6-phosphate synthase [Hymenobacter nivis]